MTLLIMVNTVVAFLSFTGIMLLAHKKKIGFVVFFFVELCFFYIGYSSGQWGIIATSIIYFFSNIYAYLQWHKDSKEDATKLLGSNRRRAVSNNPSEVKRRHTRSRVTNFDDGGNSTYLP